jgi:hypothetical protein
MHKLQTWVLSNDSAWFNALRRASVTEREVQRVSCQGSLPNCLERLAAPPAATLLLDVGGQPDAVLLVRQARQQGWAKVIVIVADPQWREAYSVISKGGADSYWVKTLDIERIRTQLTQDLS